MPDGYNKTPQELPEYKESHEVEEVKSYNENEIKDNPSPSEFGGSKKKIKGKKIFNISITSIVGVVAAVSIANSTILKEDLPTVNLNYTIYDTSLNYSVELSNYVSDLVLEVENEFTSRKIEIKDTYQEGVVDNLVKNMDYTISVVKKGSISKDVILKEKIKTLSQNTKITKLNSVTYECRCSYDGYFYFQMDLTDENKYYKNFKASLKDSNNNISEIEFKDPSLKQKIEVYDHNINGDGNVLFSITCDTYENDLVLQIVLYEVYVTV